MEIHNEELIIDIAHDLTVKAIENNMIYQGATSQETAEEVATFFTTLLNQLSGSSDN